MIPLDWLIYRKPDIAAMKAAQDTRGLIRLLDHHSPDIQWRAADALGSMGGIAVLPLISALGHWQVTVRLGAIEALGEIRDPRALEPLVHHLERDEQGETRWVAALALGSLGDNRAERPLVHALTDPEKYVRYGAAQSLDQLLLIPNDDTERAAYFIALQDWEAVRKMGSAATGALVRMLQDPDATTRVQVVRLLGLSGDSRAQEACTRGLRDGDSTVRWNAVLGAKKCGVPDTRLPWGLSKRPRTRQNPYAAALLNFLFLGLGYNYLGYWWGFLVFMSYMSIIVLAQLASGPFLPYLITYPVTALFAVQTFFMARRGPDL